MPVAGARYWKIIPALALLLLAGCKVGGSAFSLDSNSRTPALGLSLVPRQSEPKVEDDGTPNSSPPPRLASSELEAPTPKRSPRAVETAAAEDFDNGEAEDEAESDSEEESTPSTSRSNRLTSWLRPGKSEKKRITLPRTDLDDDEDEWDNEDE